MCPKQVKIGNPDTLFILINKLQFRIHLDTFGYIWIHLDTFGNIWIHLDTFR